MTGELVVLASPGDVLELMDHPRGGVIALTREAGATFLAPVHADLAGLICLTGTSESHLAIVSREFEVPAAMAVVFPGGQPEPGSLVVLDCSGDAAVVRTP